MSRKHAWSLIILGLGVLTGVILVFRPVPTTDAGTVPDAAPTENAPARSSAASPSEVARPTIGTRSAGVADLEEQRAASVPVQVPTRVRIPQLDIDVPVIEVGVDGRQMVVPEDVDTAGWYRFGPVPGQPGSAVITAHVDSRTQGVGPFARLRSAEPGTTVAIALSDGTTTTFEVVARRRYDKTQLPVGELFSRDGDPRLVLITCGGPFDAQLRRYRDNVVVHAVPRP